MIYCIALCGLLNRGCLAGAVFGLLAGCTTLRRARPLSTSYGAAMVLVAAAAELTTVVFRHLVAASTPPLTLPD